MAFFWHLFFAIFWRLVICLLYVPAVWFGIGLGPALYAAFAATYHDEALGWE